MSRPWDLPPFGAIDFHGVQRPLAHHPGGTGRRRLCWPSGSSAWLRKHLDTTPMDHWRSIRLRRVPSELLSASASTRISDVAARWGLPHAGRFAIHYAKTFGEAPSKSGPGEQNSYKHPSQKWAAVPWFAAKRGGAGILTHGSDAGDSCGLVVKGPWKRPPRFHPMQNRPGLVPVSERGPGSRDKAVARGVACRGKSRP
jgi:AraC-like DNA-binding protein